MDLMHWSPILFSPTIELTDLLLTIQSIVILIELTHDFAHPFIHMSYLSPFGFIPSSMSTLLTSFICMCAVTLTHSFPYTRSTCLFIGLLFCLHVFIHTSIDASMSGCFPLFMCWWYDDIASNVTILMPLLILVFTITGFPWVFKIIRISSWADLNSSFDFS